MPIYEYQHLENTCGPCESRFDAWQRMDEPELAHCPACGKPCKRVLSACYVAAGERHLLKENHFSKRGFAQYRKEEKGQYRKTAGDGPNTLSLKSNGE